MTVAKERRGFRAMTLAICTFSMNFEPSVSLELAGLYMLLLVLLKNTYKEPIC